MKAMMKEIMKNSDQMPPGMLERLAEIQQSTARTLKRSSPGVGSVAASASSVAVSTSAKSKAGGILLTQEPETSSGSVIKRLRTSTAAALIEEDKANAAKAASNAKVIGFIKAPRSDVLGKKLIKKGNNSREPEFGWFCVRPGPPAPFLAFGTPARFRVAGAAPCGHYAAGAAGEKKLSPTTSLRLARVCDSLITVDRLWPSAVFTSRCALPSALPCPHQQYRRISCTTCRTSSHRACTWSPKTPTLFCVR